MDKGRTDADSVRRYGMTHAGGYVIFRGMSRYVKKAPCSHFRRVHGASLSGWSEILKGGAELLPDGIGGSEILRKNQGEGHIVRTEDFLGNTEKIFWGDRAVFLN